MSERGSGEARGIPQENGKVGKEGGRVQKELDEGFRREIWNMGKQDSFGNSHIVCENY